MSDDDGFASMPGLKVKDFGERKGRGVVATQTFERGQLVHLAHAIYFPPSQVPMCNQTELQSYTYSTPDGGQLLALGFGSLFNHDESPNLDYRLDTQARVVRYYAGRKIEPGQELCIYYGASLWFAEAADGQPTDY